MSSIEPAEALVVGVAFGTLSGRAVVVRVSDGAELGSAVHDVPCEAVPAAVEPGLPAGPRAARRRLSSGYAADMERPSVRQPSMFDVARLAGVSHQTVSRVLNEHPNVAAVTRSRVRAAIHELGYRPNRAARALVTGRYQVIGIVAPHSTLFGPMSLLAAIEEQAAAAEYTISVARVRTMDEATIGEAVDRHIEQRVSGIVVIAPVASAAAALDHPPDDIPVVTVDGDPGRPGATVTVDQAEGARLAVTHLLDAGHRTVWHVSGPPDWFDAAGRIAGWKGALRDAGRDVPPVVSADWSAAAGHRAGQLLGRMPEVTAVFAANDPLALGVVLALHELGRSVPEDVSIVGFDDAPDSAFYLPPLTTVRQDFDAVAREAMDLLLARLRSGPGRESSGPILSRRTVTPTLVSRSSVAPPPARAGQDRVHR